MPDINWLHFSDIHVGQKGFDDLWPQTKEKLKRDLTILREKKCGPWDIVFFSGDLTYSATKSQFDKLESVLSELLAHLSDSKGNPILIPIPGNHDLCRIESEHPFINHMKDWHTDEDRSFKDFWEDPTHKYRKLACDAFKEYQDWFDSSKCIDQSIFKKGCLPGDISVSLEINGLKVGIVGLNSAFSCLADPINKGQIELGIRQLREVCDGDPPKWCKDKDINFIMTHHPSDWLNEYSRKQFEQVIIADGNFDIHLFGHMHKNAVREYSENEEIPRRHWQSASLFGLEHYGVNKQERRHGYAAGRIRVNPQKTVVKRKMWPRQARLINDRQWIVSEDEGFVHNPKEGGTEWRSLDRSRESASRTPKRRKPEAPTDADPELGKYLQTVVTQYTSWVSIEQSLFNAEEDQVGFNPAEVCVLERMGESGPLPISHLMASEIPRVKVLQGESGCGKTSLLRYITRELAEARKLGHHTLIPVFVRLREFCAPWSIFDYIDQNLSLLDVRLKNGSEKTLTKYPLLILLDGYDELKPDGREALRQRVERLISTERHFIIVSTRDSSPFQIQSASQLRMRDLGSDDISMIAAKYLHGHSYEFIRCMHDHDLYREAKNFLLLRLMLSIFRRSRTVPQSKWKIIKETVTAKQGMEENRGSTEVLAWRQKVEILAQIAFADIDDNKDQPDRKKLLRDIFLQMEEDRIIPQGYSIPKFISELTSTGFVQPAGCSTIEFVHSAFRTYFCALEVAKRLNKDLISIDALFKIPALRETLPITAPLLKTANDVILATLESQDLILSAEFISEIEKPSNKSLTKIVRALEARCNSTVPIIRQESIRALIRLEAKSKLANDLLYKIAEETKYDDLKTVLFEKLSRSRTARAKSIIVKNIEWQTFDWDYWGDSSHIIICALAEFGPEEQRKAFEMALDHPTKLESLSSAISRIVSENRLSLELMNVIWIAFCKNMKLHDYGLSSGLAKCVQAFPDDSYVPKLLELLEQHSGDQDHSFANLVADILKSIKTDAAMNLLLKSALSDKSEWFKAYCIDVLSRCHLLVPIESARVLIQKTKNFARSRAIVCLGKHRLEQIRDDLLEALQNSDEIAQMRAVEILAAKGDLARVDFTKIPLTRNIIRIIINNTEKYSIIGLKDLLLTFPDYYTITQEKEIFLAQDDLLMFDLAGALLRVGQEVEAERIVDSYLRGKSSFSEFGLSYLAELLPKLQEKTALRAAKRILRPKAKDVSDSLRISRHHCWESIEKMTSRIFIHMLKKRFHSMMRDGMERADYIRALLQIIIPADEPWFLRVSNDLGDLVKEPWMSAWVLNILIKIASQRSIPLVRKIFALNSNNRSIVDRCYKAVRAIQLRQRITVELTEDAFRRILTI